MWERKTERVTERVTNISVCECVFVVLYVFLRVCRLLFKEI